MKIKNIFKKSEKTVVKANIQKLEKNQLEKVIGGGDESPIDEDAANSTRPGKAKYVKIKMK